MVSRRVRSKYLRSCPAGLGDDAPHLPHHIMLEVLSFLDAGTIVRSRGVSRSFRADAPMLVSTLKFGKDQKFPSIKTVSLYSNVEEIRLEGHNRLVNNAAAWLRGASSLRRLDISRPPSLEQKTPLSKTAVKKLFALPLVEFEMRGVEFQIPPHLRMPFWGTLEKLVIRDGYLCDSSIINLVACIPAGSLPLRHLDLSRNLFGLDNAMRPLAQALRSFPEMETLELAADRIEGDGAELIMRELLDGACPRLRTLDLSLNFLRDGVLDYLAGGIGRTGHGLQNLRKLAIGGRVCPDETVTCLESVARALAAGGLPLLDFLHLQGDLGLPQVSPLLRNLKLGGCPNLAVVKIEQSAPLGLGPAEHPDSNEDAIGSMHELVTSSRTPRLRELHVLGMSLGKGLEWAEEKRMKFYRAGSESSFHRLAVAGAARGVTIYV
eukprot:g11324.t1